MAALQCGTHSRSTVPRRFVMRAFRSRVPRLRRRVLISALALAAAAIGVARPAAPSSCSTVAFDGQAPPADAGNANPNSHPLSKTFDSEVAVNLAGDTVFVAPPIGLPDRLYLYRHGLLSLGEAVAIGGEPAPNSKVFRKTGVFRKVSINDSGDLAFSASLLFNSQALFVRKNGGALQTAADIETASPAGGVFESFPAVSMIN